jgi:putative aldouronate transport system permease protein
MKGVRRELTRNRSLYAMMIPGIAFLFLFNYLPMFGVILAFKNYRLDLGILGSPWSVPFVENFRFFFTGAYAWRVTRNTLFLNIAFLASGLVFEGSFALILNEIRSRFLKRTIQSFAFFPYFISWIVVGFFAFSMLNYDYGVLNTTLKAFGLGPVGWYSNPSYWPWILVFINRWKWTGYGAIIYLAVLSSIDPGLYEAAEIDGATRWQRVWYISIPHMIPTMALLTLLAIGRIMNADFGMFYAVVGGNSTLYPSADVIDTFVFRSIRKLGDYGMAAATGLYQSVLSFVLIIISNAVANRYFGNSGLFSFSRKSRS